MKTLARSYTLHPPRHPSWAESKERLTPFGAYIQWLLRQSPLSQKGLADELGISTATLSNILHARKAPLPHHLIDKIVKVLCQEPDKEAELRYAAKISCLKYNLNDLEPWRYELAHTFYGTLQKLSREGGELMALLLQMNTLWETDSQSAVS